MLDAVLVVSLAFAAGVVGTWSPCGLSTIETLVGADAPTRGEPRLILSVGTFTAGSVAGALVTFGLLGLAGATITGAGLAAVVVLGAAGVLEILGAPVVPRIARQVPEPWRRRYPLPVTGLLYGALLGLGFTTYVMSYAVWAAAALAALLSSPVLALGMGVAFGLGRAVPIAALSLSWSRGGMSALDRVITRPQPLTTARRGVGVLALLCAAGLGFSQSATAAVIPGAYAVSREGPAIAISRESGSTLRIGTGPLERLPGTDAALGGGVLAWRRGNRVTVVDLSSRSPRAGLTITGVNAIAVEGAVLGFRADRGRRSVIGVVDIASRRRVQRIRAAGPRGSLSRPSIDGGLLVFARSDRRVSEVLAGRARGTARFATVRRARPRTQILGPSLAAGRLSWIELTRCRQELRTGRLGASSSRLVRWWSSPSPRDGGFERGYVDAYNEASRCPGTESGGARVRLFSTERSAGRIYLTLTDRGGLRPRTLEFRHP